MTHTDDTTPLRISGPAELLAAVPYLLGFHPADSLVLVGLADSRLVATARLDLTDATDEVLAATVVAMQRGDATHVIAALYCDTPPAGDTRPNEALADRLIEQVEQHAVLVDLLLVASDRYWSYLGTNTQCFAGEGTLLPLTTTVFEAAATYAGITVAATRDHLADVFTPVHDRGRLAADIWHAQRVMTPMTRPEGGLALHGRVAVTALLAAATGMDVDPTTELDDTDLARLGASLQHLAVRDAVWMAIDDGQINGVTLWLHLARNLPSPYDAPALFLHAWQTWRSGNGALAGIAAELALKSDPTYTAAEILLTAIAAGINPHIVPKLFLARDAGTDDTTR